MSTEIVLLHLQCLFRLSTVGFRSSPGLSTGRWCSRRGISADPVWLYDRARDCCYFSGYVDVPSTGHRRRLYPTGLVGLASLPDSIARHPGFETFLTTSPGRALGEGLKRYSGHCDVPVGFKGAGVAAVLNQPGLGQDLHRLQVYRSGMWKSASSDYFLGLPGTHFPRTWWA